MSTSVSWGGMGGGTSGGGGGGQKSGSGSGNGSGSGSGSSGGSGGNNGGDKGNSGSNGGGDQPQTYQIQVDISDPCPPEARDDDKGWDSDGYYTNHDYKYSK
ncbi:hypothetical protein JX266_006242 [Neoarthrinium moseri]|nr:hypothetical protein JX266_006242 [Neoarthrinium moseri]